MKPAPICPGFPFHAPSPCAGPVSAQAGRAVKHLTRLWPLKKTKRKSKEG